MVEPKPSIVISTPVIVHIGEDRWCSFCRQSVARCFNSSNYDDADICINCVDQLYRSRNALLVPLPPKPESV